MIKSFLKELFFDLKDVASSLGDDAKSLSSVKPEISDAERLAMSWGKPGVNLVDSQRYLEPGIEATGFSYVSPNLVIIDGEVIFSSPTE